MTDILKRVNRTRLTPELLGEAVEMHTSLSEDDRSAMEVRTTGQSAFLNCWT